MFKVESYITPIILSYVNRYINNFKPEDSQVSLWGGDATFHNLELNLEVLEQELQLPFSFVSGSIRELSIHVPWTKIASEPITITINTIECILNLKGKNSTKTSDQGSKKEKKIPGQSKEVEAPPGYIQSLINKIVSNISIHCNNLILKYVEEDIVLSMNVKLLKFESANEKWEPAYTDLSPAQVILRKVISVNDLTLCLDKRNASGKIEVYQEPMLYRCSMTMHLLRHYHSATANRASTTRLDVYCNNMEFSMTEQQVPMLMRLLMLLYALHQKQLKPENGSATHNSSSPSDSRTENLENDESWTGWAWSYVSSVLPAPWDDEWTKEELKNHSGHTLHFGFYVDRASVTFKVSESNNERGYYSHKKLRYWPMVTLDLQGIYSDTVIHGLQWFNCTGGVSEATLIPVGYCSCGYTEVNESTAPYLKLGSPSNFHKSDSLFDAEATENKGGRRHYDTSWDHHMSTNTESVLLERTPAFAFDYVYRMEIPNDMSSDVLSDLGSNYEFSNLSESSSLRLCMGPFRLRLCSGLFHRLSTLQIAATFYDYPPYYTPKADLPFQDLLPPSEEDFDALNEFIPIRTVRVTFFAPLVELELMDHPYFQANRGCMFRRSKKQSTASMSTTTSALPKITIECQFIDISTQYPMYVNRLVHTTCQLPEPPKKLFDACYTKKNIKIVGLLSRLATNSSCQSTILTPSSVSFASKGILKPQYWINSDIPHEEAIFESESLTVNGTKAKMLVVYNIIEKMLGREPDMPGKGIFCTNLLSDASRDYGFPYMELCIEGVRFKKVMTNSTQTIDMSVESLKAFIFETIACNDKDNIYVGSKNDASKNIQQVLFVSGPEPKSVSEKEKKDLSKSVSENSHLLTVTIQFPLSPDVQKHPPILIFNLQEIRICMDPLLCKWLLYVPKSFVYSELLESSLSKTKSFSEASGSFAETPRKMSSHQIESVHSSSDRDTQQMAQKIVVLRKEESAIDVQEKVYNFLKTWFDVWKGMFLCGDVSQCTIYFPMVSLSAVGSQGIQEAVEQAINKDNPPDVMVITLPFANIRSAQRQSVGKYLRTLPVSLPESVWSIDKSSFPWTMSISELSCYTIQFGNKLIFLKPVSLSATLGLSTRPSKSSTSPTNDNQSSQHVRKNSVNSKTSSNLVGTSLTHSTLRITSASTPNSPQNSQSVGQTSSSNMSTRIDIGYLGVCVHIDMTPIVISTSEVQVYLFASILYGLMEVAASLLPRNPVKSGVKVPDAVPTFVAKGSSTLSPTIIKENTLDSASEKTPPLTSAVNTDNIETDSVKLTAWVQWTITRFTIELLSSEYKGTKQEELESLQPRLKLVVDAEDIVSSLDFQSVYLKVKSKIGSASIRHYKRASPSSKWVPGPYSGIVLRLRDDLTTNQRQEDNGLISVTITRASCQHTHTLWGAVQKKNKDKKPEANTQLLSRSRYITEVVINIQPLDFIISLSTLRSFYLVLIPLLNIPVTEKKSDDPSGFLSNFNNQNLPLAYLDCQDVRLVMPSSELLGSGNLHDVIVFQLQKISLNPQAVNPICRTPIRSDIYDQAAHARILDIPGSEVEDRQYQLDLIGMSVSTGTWDDIDSVLSPASNVLSNLRGTSENPALEWNILEQGQPNMTPMLNLKHVVDKFDITIVAAPAMVYKDNTTICGHSIEMNLVTDIFVNLSLHQIKLLSALLAEFVMLVTPLIMEDGILKRPKIKFPYSRFDSVFSEVDEEKEIRSIEGQNKDSGIDTSDVKSVQSAKAQASSLTTKLSTDSEKQHIFPRPPNTVPYIYSAVPVEAVLTAGKISVCLYQVDNEKPTIARHKGKKKKMQKRTEEDQGYEASEESMDDKTDSYKKYTPLLFLSFTQPNAFLAKQQLGRKIQISCFNLNLKLSEAENSTVSHLPNEDDFPVGLLETRAGTPNPTNGILPAFFTVKFIKGVGKNSKIELDVSKPTKILCQMSKWGHLLTIKDKVVDTFNSGGGSDSFMRLLKSANARKKKENMGYSRNPKANDTYVKFQEIKELLGGTNSLTVRFDQVIFAVSSEGGHKLHLGMQKLKTHLSISSRPEKICLSSTFNCLTLTVIYESFKKLLLNPWTITTDVCVFWESWQDINSNPQLQITAESDCILVDVTSEQIKCVEMVLKDVNEFLTVLPRREDVATKENAATRVANRDQHYKDDLRAGAFQFVDSTSDHSDEMPLPYQVMFWSKNVSAMAWKYPQPRSLTKVRVFPVPYKMALGPQESLLVLCHLEYWSDCRNCYLPYTQFYLSESEVCHLNLPKGCPKGVVASTWRVVISTCDEKKQENVSSNVGVSPRALAACMRIDSYFNKSLIPNLNVALYITKLEVSLYNFFPKNSSAKLPDCLKKYSSDMSFPENQRFMTLSLDNLSSYLSTWNFDTISTELTFSLHSTVLDYGFLTDQMFIEPFTSKIELCLSNALQINYISKPVQVRFGPSIAHTLAVSSQMWHQNFVSDKPDKNFVIVTRYVICNDSNVGVRFGQSGTEESVFLPSRSFHLYSWRSQKKKQLLRLSIEENGWVWSKSFAVIEEGVQTLHFGSEKSLTLFISIKNLSKTQKQITIFGQVIVCNMLSEHFEMKIVEAVTENREQEFRSAQSHIVAGKSAAPSVFVSDGKGYFLRLRFYGLESAWTGDIPLREHATGSQPWLVKVPLQERGQFLSVWCRIIVQDFPRCKRILAMLWPLFMVKSNLPTSAKVHIETPTLGVHLDSVVNGKGELQQLYCPGTIDHSHQITFQLEEGNSNIYNPYVPLNYSLVDQLKFFKKSPKEDIEVILESLNHCYESKWPYFGDDLDNIDWIVDSQPLTHVQVRYQNASPHSCALLVELLPWCLTVNTFGTPIGIMLNGVELCRVQHHGIVAPPRLEETFHLGVSMNSNWFFSGPLQLAKSDWSQTFYMPKITGTIPLDGTIKTSIKCDSYLCTICITSQTANEIRLLRLSSTHILSNHMAMQMHVICMAVPDGKGLFDIPKDVEKFCFAVAPHLQKSHCGIPIIHWYTLKQDSDISNTECVLYVAFSVDPKLGWSCPIRVDKPMIRKAFSVNSKQFSIPVVLTAQEIKGQVFLSIHNDPRPQIFIENKTNVPLFCGQSLPDDSGILNESDHFKWTTKIGSFSSVYYTMPVISEKFPELPQVYFSEKISIAYDNEDGVNDLQWSAGVSIVNNNDLFIRVPFYGDVKLTITNSACTTFLTIESVSQVEISARDIRVRLSMRELEKAPPVFVTNRELERFVKNTTYDELDDISLNTPTTSITSLNPSSFQTLPTVTEQSQIVPRLDLNSPKHGAMSDSSSSSIHPYKTKSLLVNTIPLKDGWNSVKVNVFVKTLGVTLISDLEGEGDERWELAGLVCDDVILTAVQTQQLKIKLSLSDIQLDNQLYSRESFDFPVVLIGQDKKPVKKLNILNIPMESLLENLETNSLIVVSFVLESWRNESANKSFTGITTMKISLNPISCFIEDIYVTRLMQYLKTFHIVNLVLWPTHRSTPILGPSSTSVNVPELVSWQCAILAQPHTIRTFIVSPVSILLSIHSSVKMYIALDQSPLQFGKFERRRLFTTHYRLGHALAMHYLSGAIFGAGWVVSSLELLGSPGGLARAMGTGLRDFVSLPYRGLIQGPMAFLKGITTGSASLMRHVTAGTLQSVTKLASSVARNLDRLTLDEEHQKRTEEQRRQRPQGVAQGFMQGMTSLGISLLGAVGGIAHHPLQSVMSSGASPRSLAAGVGLGLVGVITKPLSGAAELVALTGQGLLQGAGWNSLPDPRNLPQTIKIALSNNSTLKYNWKFINLPHSQMLYVTEATSVTSSLMYTAVALILTIDSVIVINLENDEVQKLMSLDEVSTVSTNDPTLLSLKHAPPKSVQKEEKIEDEIVPMDPEMRARVADYVRSTVGLLNLPEVGSVHSEISISPLSSPGLPNAVNEETTVMNFYISSQKISYFCCLLCLAKQHSTGNHFPVL